MTLSHGRTSSGSWTTRLPDLSSEPALGNHPCSQAGDKASQGLPLCPSALCALVYALCAPVITTSSFHPQESPEPSPADTTSGHCGRPIAAHLYTQARPLSGRRHEELLLQCLGQGWLSGGVKHCRTARTITPDMRPSWSVLGYTLLPKEGL